mmetsp:Transcript_7346/g.12976  ORF Transcript_7346/g.12976 Transcript_7346/m.12976 type:complete len:127 (-) Transcript_7346:701-1081(-)
MLRRENELRLAPETQAEFRAAGMKSGPSAWLGVVEVLQRRVAAEFGLAESVGLDALRLAEVLCPGDPEIKEISLYRKYNRCRDGAVSVGDAPGDAPLIRVADASSARLHDLLHTKQPTVLFVGSYT